MSDLTKSSHELTREDIKLVLEELANEVSSKWYQIGIQLSISPDKLDSLQQQNGDDCTAKLCKVLVTWINKTKATWEGLIGALQSETVGNRVLAEQLRKDYCTQDSVEDIQDTCITEAGATCPVDTPGTEVSGKQKPAPTTVKRLVKSVPPRFHKSYFVQSQKADKFCCKCKQIPNTAQRSSCCRSVYCGVCQTKVTACPKCKQKPVKIQKDQDLTSKIGKVKIKCLNNYDKGLYMERGSVQAEKSSPRRMYCSQTRQRGKERNYKKWPKEENR